MAAFITPIKTSSYLLPLERAPLPAHIDGVKATYQAYFKMRTQTNQQLKQATSPSLEIATVKSFNSTVECYKGLKEQISSLQARYVVDRTGAPTTGDAGEILPGYLALSQIEDNCDRLQRRLTDRLVTHIPYGSLLEAFLDIDYGAPMVSPSQETRQHRPLQSYCREFPLYQPIRGDGNCFYTAFAMTLLQTQEGRDAVLAKLVTKAKLTRNEKACKFIINLINADKGDLAQTFWRNNKFMLPLVHFMRHEAATWMSRNPDEIQLHVLAEEAGLTIEQYLDQNIRTMGVDADDTVKTALSQAFNFPTETIDLASKQRYPSHDDRPSQLALARDGEHYFALLPQRA